MGQPIGIPSKQSIAGDRQRLPAGMRNSVMSATRGSLGFPASKWCLPLSSRQVFSGASETGGFSPDIRAVVRFAPTGGVDELLRLVIEGGLGTGEALVPCLVIAGWLVASAVAFKLLYRRLLRDN